MPSAREAGRPAVRAGAAHMQRHHAPLVSSLVAGKLFDLLLPLLFTYWVLLLLLLLLLMLLMLLSAAPQGPAACFPVHAGCCQASPVPGWQAH